MCHLSISPLWHVYSFAYDRRDGIRNSCMSFCAKSASISQVDFSVDIVASKKNIVGKSLKSSLSLFVVRFRFFSTLRKHDITVLVSISQGNRSLTSYTRKIAFDRRSSWNIDGDISISKFDLLCDMTTSSMTSWIRIYIDVSIISWFLCTGSVMMISLLIF